MIELSQAYKEYIKADNVEFRVCTQAGIPYPDEHFDLVVSHDVIEHVEDPWISLKEIHRILKPGGKALLAFPPYHGAFSHHLDYLTLLPALHWFFGADTLVEAVNREIGRGGIPLGRQEAKQSHDGSRRVLPTLNGLTGRQATQMLERLFETVEIDPCPISRDRGAAAKFLAAPFEWAGRLGPAIKDFSTLTLHCRVTKARN